MASDPSPRRRQGGATRAGDETRSALIEAAIHEFSRSSFDSVSLRDIERRAKVNRGLAAYHFSSKDELWRQAVDALMGDFHDVMDRYSDLFELVSGDERGRILLKVFVNFVAKRPEFFRIMVLEGDDTSERTKWFNDRYLRRLVDFYHRNVGIEDERSAEEAAIDHFRFTGAACMIFAASGQAKQLFGLDVRDPAFVERFAQRIAEIGYATERA